MSTTRKERVRELLLKRANRLGLSLEQLAGENRDNARYAQMHAGIVESRRTLLEILNEAVGTAVASTYPSPACLLPFEAEDFASCVADKREVPEELQLHVENCPFCANTVRPDDGTGMFLTHLRTILKEDSPVSGDRSSFSAWLSKSDWEPVELHAWLTDPQDIDDCDPELLVRTLLKSVLESDRNESLQRELARRLASLLSTDINLHARHEDEYAIVDRPLISRALELAANLVPDDSLFEALWNIHNRNSQLIEHLALTTVLRRALIGQQTDQRYFSELEHIIEQQQITDIEGEPIEAYQGILAMYSHRNPADADKELLCKELGVIANYLATHYGSSRRQRFSQLLSSSLRQLSWPLNTWELVLLAHRFGWPRWAVQCLPNLFAIKAPQEQSDSAEILAWQPLAYVMLNQDPPARFERLCHGEVIRMSLATEEADIFNDLGSFLDSERSRYVYQSSKGCRVIATETLRQFVSNRYPDLGPRACEASYRVLKESNIGAVPPNLVAV